MPRWRRWYYKPKPWESSYPQSQSIKKKSTQKQKKSNRGNRYSLTETMSMTMDYLSQSSSWDDDEIEDNELLGLDIPIATTQVGTDDVFLGRVNGHIVGIQYYSGMVNNHEMVSLVREPSNKYDRNAIKAENVWGEKVGHIKRELAEALAYIMDNNYARLEGLVPSGSRNTFKIPVEISLYGPLCNKTVVHQRLASRGFSAGMIEERAGFRGAPSQSKSKKKSSTYNPRSALGKSVILSEAEMKNEVDTLFDNLKSLDKTTEQAPNKCIVSVMYPHQKQALNWMLARENNNKLPTFWEKTPAGLYHNSLTNCTSANKPESVCGGILADEMGLGKTLSVIALILHDFVMTEEVDDPPSLPSLPKEVGSDGPSTSQALQKVEDEVVTLHDSEEVLMVLEEVPLVSESTVPMDVSEDVIIIEDDVQSTINGAPVVTVKDIPCTTNGTPVVIAEDVLGTTKSAPVVVKDDTISSPAKTVQLTATGRPKRASAAKVKFIFNDESDDNPSPEKKAKKKEPKATKPSKAKGQSSTKGKGKGKKARGNNATTNPAVVLGRGPPAPGPIPPITSQSGASLPITSLPVPSQPITSLPGASRPITSLPGLSKPSTSTPGPSHPITSQSGPYQPITSLPGPSKPSSLMPGPSSSMKAEVKGHSGGGDSKKPCPTLIVCPLSVLSNWIDQFGEHVADEARVNVCLYYGANRKKLKATDLKEQDVVITTYNTMAAEFKASKERSTLQKIEWLRVVLDEAHTIRNHGTLQTQAAHALKAQRKWALTGTPIQNSIKDLWSLVAFLGVEPFKSTHNWWQRIIARPIQQNNSLGIDRVRKLMETLALRRMKSQKVNGKPIVDLPARNVVLQYVDFSDEERDVYKTMEKDGRLAVSKYFQQGSVLDHYGDILAILMRLRQLCCHPGLCAKAAAKLCQATDTSEKTDEEKAQLVATLVSFLSQGADEECCICLESIEDPVITRCAHVFCQRCIGEVIVAEKDHSRCPLCRQAVSRDSLVHVPKDRSDTENEETDGEWHSSAKVDALMECLLKQRAADKTTKSIVVSQFTSFLDLLKKPLTEKGFKFNRLDGSMSNNARTAAIREFSSKDPDSPQIFLLSLKAGGVGLNLTAASRLYLLDPAWNPACEEQCFDRCHRLGQTKDVTITKFLVRNSVEEAMLQLQEIKRQLMKRVFDGKNQTPEERRTNRVRDIKILMGMK